MAVVALVAGVMLAAGPVFAQEPAAGSDLAEDLGGLLRWFDRQLDAGIAYSHSRTPSPPAEDKGSPPAAPAAKAAPRASEPAPPAPAPSGEEGNPLTDFLAGLDRFLDDAAGRTPVRDETVPAAKSKSVEVLPLDRSPAPSAEKPAPAAKPAAVPEPPPPPPAAKAEKPAVPSDPLVLGAAKDSSAERSGSAPAGPGLLVPPVQRP